MATLSRNDNEVLEIRNVCRPHDMPASQEPAVLDRIVSRLPKLHLLLYVNVHREEEISCF